MGWNGLVIYYSPVDPNRLAMTNVDIINCNISGYGAAIYAQDTPITWNTGILSGNR